MMLAASGKSCAKLAQTVGIGGSAAKPATRPRSRPAASLNLGWLLGGLTGRQRGAGTMAFTQERWWDASTVAVVTGANKGIGFEIAWMLAEEGLTTVMTARNEALGQQALQKLQAKGLPGRLLLHQLDISDPASVDCFAKWLQKDLGGATILVNNAGFAFKGDVFGAKECEETLAINLLGTMDVCEKLKPLLQPPARIINVSSRAGKRAIIRSPAKLAEVTGAASKEEVVKLARQFVSAIAEGQHTQRGWPSSMYGVSKLLLSQYTQLLAKELQPAGVMVNAMCPGWCATDMSSNRGTKSAAEGADTAVWLALRPPGDFVTGGFYGERGPIDW